MDQDKQRRPGTVLRSGGKVNLVMSLGRRPS
jgi:hypothetical protein